MDWPQCRRVLILWYRAACKFGKNNIDCRIVLTSPSYCLLPMSHDAAPFDALENTKAYALFYSISIPVDLLDSSCRD
jgi:hypothetical protein